MKQHTSDLLSSNMYSTPIQSPNHAQWQPWLQVYLEDYAIGKDNNLSNEDALNFALYVDFDQVTFENTVIGDHWIQPMNEKSQAIEKNNI